MPPLNFDISTSIASLHHRPVFLSLGHRPLILFMQVRERKGGKEAKNVMIIFRTKQHVSSKNLIRFFTGEGGGVNLSQYPGSS